MNASDLTAISLFDGIGGFPLALDRHGVRTVAAVEINQQAAGVVRDRFPDIVHFPDVTEVTADELRAAGFVPERGIVTGGWPCQDLSLAGRRLGLGGARSGLFFEIVRLAADLRPRWLVLENVPGLLSSVCNCPGLDVCGAGCADPHTVRGGACGPGRCMEIHGGAMGAVLGELGNLGYGFAYRVLDAQHFGVPQRRRRVVIVGHSGDWAAPASVLLEPEGSDRHPAPRRPAGSRAARVAADRSGNGSDAVGALATNGDRIGVTELETLISEPAVSYALRADPGGVGQGHNTTYVPVAGPLQSQGSDGRGHRIDAEGAANGHLVPVAYQGHGSNVGPMGTLRAGNGEVTGGVPFVESVRGSVTHALTSEGGDASEDGTGRGTPVIAFGHTQGFDLQESETATPTLRAGGDGGAVMTDIDWQGGSNQDQIVSPDGVAPTVVGASNAHGGHHQSKVIASSAVRRLTPVECERLQGFPDGWTATSDGKPQADSNRYRQMGNSIAVPVFAWVVGRIMTYERTTERN